MTRKLTIPYDQWPEDIQADFIEIMSAVGQPVMINRNSVRTCGFAPSGTLISLAGDGLSSSTLFKIDYTEFKAWWTRFDDSMVDDPTTPPAPPTPKL